MRPVGGTSQTVLVSGAFGALGRYVVDALVAAGHRVRAFDLLTEKSRRTKLPHGAVAVFGDLRDREAVARAAASVDAIVHLAFVIYPQSERDPERAADVNLGGSRNLIAAAEANDARFIFASSFHVHRFVRDRQTPITVDAPLDAHNVYAQHKIAVEAALRASKLRYAILRLSSIMIDRKLDEENLRIIFDIPLETRIEMVHPRDAARAFANAVTTPELDGRTMFIGGGPSCQSTYREMLARAFAESGMSPLPDEAFAREPAFIGDWLDTRDSEALLRYQQHTFEDYYASLRTKGLERLGARAFGPLVKRWMVSKSPYYAQQSRQERS